MRNSYEKQLVVDVLRLERVKNMQKKIYFHEITQPIARTHVDELRAPVAPQALFAGRTEAAVVEAMPAAEDVETDNCNEVRLAKLEADLEELKAKLLSFAEIEGDDASAHRLSSRLKSLKAGLEKLIASVKTFRETHTCSLTLLLMRSPVTISTGQSYEQDSS